MHQLSCSLPRVNVQIVVQDLDVKQLLQCGLDLLDTRVTKLKHFAGVGEDDVVVLLDPITLLVLRNLVAKLVFADEVAIDEQINGIVESRTTDAILVGGHVSEQAHQCRNALRTHRSH